MTYLISKNDFLKDCDGDILVEKLCRRFENFAQDVMAAVSIMDQESRSGGTRAPAQSLLEVLDFSDGFGARVDVDVCLVVDAVSNCFCLTVRTTGCSAVVMIRQPNLQCACAFVRLQVDMEEEEETEEIKGGDIDEEIEEFLIAGKRSVVWSENTGIESSPPVKGSQGRPDKS